MGHYFFLKGVLLGLAIAAPVGPIGVLCIRRTVAFGRWSGLCSGLGAALADTIYGIVAAFGLTAISHLLLESQIWLRLIGGGFLVYLGVWTFFAKPKEKDTSVSHTTLLGDFVSTFFLTLTNPLTIFSYIAIFAGLGLTAISHDYYNATWVVLGIFIGSSLWWLILSEGITLFRKKIGEKTMVGINRLAGLIIAGFGLLAWISLL